MTHTQRLYAVLSALVLAAVALIGGAASPASASGAVPIAVPISPVTTMAGPSNCPNSSMCGYVDGGFRTGQGYEISPVRSNGTCENVAFNDAWSSIHNGSGKTVRFFAQANCAGTTSSSFTLANGSNSSSLTWSHPTFADEISSYRWNG